MRLIMSIQANSATFIIHRTTGHVTIEQPDLEPITVFAPNTKIAGKSNGEGSEMINAIRSRVLAAHGTLTYKIDRTE